MSAIPMAMQRARDAWRERQPRERLMVTVMVAMVAAFVLWYAVYVPLRTLRDAAHAQRIMATAQWNATQADAAALQAMQQSPALTPPTTAEALRKAVTESAGGAGFAITRQRDGELGTWEIEADGASTAQLFAWLDLMRTRHALAPDTLSAVRSGHQLRVQASFRPRAETLLGDAPL